MPFALCLPPSLRNTDFQEKTSIPYHCRSSPWCSISSPHWSQPSHCLPSPSTPLQLNSSTPDLSMDFSWKKCFFCVKTPEPFSQALLCPDRPCSWKTLPHSRPTSKASCEWGTRLPQALQGKQSSYTVLWFQYSLCHNGLQLSIFILIPIYEAVLDQSLAIKRIRV